MSDRSPEQLTLLLQRWNQGDDHALEALITHVFSDLRKMARYQMARERSNHTLQPTALVNEAYLKLAREAKLAWQGRTHFFAVASRAMRQVLVDEARRRRRKKRPGKITILPLNEALVFSPEVSEEVLALDRALKALALELPRKAKVAEMRYFSGMSVEEIAEALKISPNTVTRDWNLAKAWLRRRIESERGF
jgi:RNA polymerase sigma-70 factor (ECF subfamily)